MARYIARFMKDVLGENGHETEICQRSIEVEAPSRGLAPNSRRQGFVKPKTSGIGFFTQIGFTLPMRNSRHSKA